MEPTAQVTQPSKAQWEEIAKKLDSLFDTVFLRCDGYLVTASLRRTDKNRLKIITSVNGWHFKGQWLPTLTGDDKREMSEEARRFWMPRKRARMTQKELKLWEKVLGKRECRKRGYYDYYVWPDPVWNRPMPFIRQLKKMNQAIEVLDYDTYAAELEKVKEAAGE
jgi:hypothetical protein